MGKTIIIEKSGVVEYTENNLFVNSEDIVSESMNRVKMARPKQNYMGAFAARVILSVELLGDTEGKKGVVDELKETERGDNGFGSSGR